MEDHQHTAKNADKNSGKWWINKDFFKHTFPLTTELHRVGNIHK